MGEFKLVLDIDEVDGNLPENKIIHGNVLEALKRFPDESIDCVITSPPYWAKSHVNT